MNYEDRPQLTDEQKEAMAEQYGNSTREAVKPLSTLIELILARQDIMGFCFACEAIGGLMEDVCRVAQQIQAARGEHRSTLH